jgi:type IV pilus assembly protein PilE
MRKQRGFTLIELMITVAVVALLAAIAYPSYQSQIRRSRRTEARTALLQVQVAEEKYFLTANRYGSLAEIGANSSTTNGAYTIDLSVQTNTTFTARATAAGAQAKDTACATFTIDYQGNKTPTAATCWR